MKKTYSKPLTQVIDIEATNILCASDPDPLRWGGEFGQVPGLTTGADERLA